MPYYRMPAARAYAQPGLAHRTVTIVTAILTAVCAGCSEPPGPSPPNFIVVTIDTLRADHLGAYGYERATSPNIDRFAADSVLFENAITTAPWTRPATGSLFTGLHPGTLGLTCANFNNPRADCDVLPQGVTTLAEALRARGYATAGLIANIQVDSSFGFDQGFDSYENVFDELAQETPNWRERWHLFEWRDVSTEKLTERALSWLAKYDSNQPFYLYLHYLDPHDPHDPPESYSSRFPVESYTAPNEKIQADAAGYDAEIAFVDDHIAKLLNGIDFHGLSATTVVILTSDHGEGFGEHGVLDWRHGLGLYEHLVRVPFIVRLPNANSAGIRVGEQVSLIDVMPTLLELAGAAPTKRIEGRSLVPALNGDSLLQISAVSGWGYSELVSLRAPPWKLIVNEKAGHARLFNLVTDPGEFTDVSRSYPERTAAMRQELEARLSEFNAASRTIPRDTEDPVLSEDQRERLESLGYTD